MAIDTAENILIARAPQYFGDARLPDYLGLAEQQTGAAFCENRNLAVALRALHMLTLADNKGARAVGSIATGGLKEEKEGDLQRKYGILSDSVSESNPDLSQTIYGLELIELQKTSLILPRNRTILDACS